MFRVIVCCICILSIALICTVVALKTSPDEDFYHAAVVEYASVHGKDVQDTFTTNADKYVSWIEQASEIADIVVFPEAALLIEDHTVFIEVPSTEDNSAPVDEEKYHPVLRKLSGAARQNQIYVVINLHEEYIDGSNKTYHYNTNVIFDRNGTVIAKYHKYHLFGKLELTSLNRPKVPEVVFFDTDFGVRFGTFTCFDILFEQPAQALIEKNVTDVVYPLFWFPQIPFLTGIQVQTGWSFGKDIHLLAAGENIVRDGHTGSGIYRGREGPIVQLQSQVTTTNIMAAKIYKKGKVGQSVATKLPSTDGVREDLHFFKENVTLFNTESLLPKFDLNSMKRSSTEDPTKYNMTRIHILKRTLCQGQLCCHFQIDMSITYKSKDYFDPKEESFSRTDSYFHHQYRLAVFSGVKKFVGGVQVCAIIPCLNESLSSCTSKRNGSKDILWEDNGNLVLYSTSFNSVSINAEFNTERTFVAPNILESASDPNRFGEMKQGKDIKMEETGSKVQLEFQSDKLVTGGLYARAYGWDPSGLASLLALFSNK